MNSIPFNNYSDACLIYLYMYPKVDADGFDRPAGCRGLRQPIVARNSKSDCFFIIDIDFCAMLNG